MKGLCVDIKTGDLEEIISTIDAVSQYCDAVKINLQSVLGLTLDGHKRINEKIHSYGKFSIIDAKLGDIGSTNDLAFKFYRDAGYDALTFNPYSFNITEAVEKAAPLKLYVLVLMSNPQALKLQKQKINNEYLYEKVARECVEAGAYGVVVGATVSDGDYDNVKSITGQTSVLLPGIGVQGGGIRKECLNVVGRSITDSENVRGKVKEFYERTRD
jgi:orotidine-5'-phosphate decarboxylase